MTSHGYKQNEISRELSMGTKIFKRSYYTVFRAFSFIKKIKNFNDSATLGTVSSCYGNYKDFESSLNLCLALA
jgi:hypothetical protein